MKLPDDNQLNIMWTVATSSSIESGTRPHLIFARLLYSSLTNEKPRVGLANDLQSISQGSV
jgi:hypothetical protein